MTWFLAELGWTLLAIVPLCLLITGTFDVLTQLAAGRWSAARLYSVSWIAVCAIGASPIVVVFGKSTFPVSTDTSESRQVAVAVQRSTEFVNDVIVAKETSAAVQPDRLALIAQVRLLAWAYGLPCLAIVWLGITAILFLRAAWTPTWLWRWAVQHASKLSEDDTAQFDAVARDLGVNDRITWLETAHGDSPYLFGWLFPIVVIPASLRTRLSENELHCVVLHELIHARFRDALWNTILHYLRLVFLYQPHVVRLLNRVQLYCEFRCDDFAIRHLGDRVQYAHTLRQLIPRQRESALAFELPANYACRERLERLLNHPSQFSVSAFSRGVAVITLGLLLLPAVKAMSRHDGRWQMDSRRSSTAFPPVVVDERHVPLSDVATNGRIILPANGRLVLRDEIRETTGRKLIIKGLNGRSTVIQARSVKRVVPFLKVEWPDSAETMMSDTDSGSGRGNDALVIIPGNPHLDHVQVSVSDASLAGGQYFLIIRQPRFALDIDADYIGLASSLLLLDNHLRTQLPSHPNMQPPAIDAPNDIDTFQIWPAERGELVITVDGYRDELHPRVQVFDDRGKPLHDGAASDGGFSCRVIVDNTVSCPGFYIAVSGANGQTGEYSLQVHVN